MPFFSLTLTLEFDGERFRCGKVSFRPFEGAKVEGVSFDVPIEFAVFMLSVGEEAERFLKEVAAAPLFIGVKKDLLREAARNGVDQARSKLQRYLRDAPCGKPRFYRDCYDVCLIDGTTCIIFDAEEDLRAVIKNLPENVYHLENIHRAPLKMSLEMFKRASSEIDDFFGFMKKIMLVSKYVSRKNIVGCLNAWFKNRDEANRLLKKIERDTEHRRRRDDVYMKLIEEKVLRCKGGFLVSIEGHSGVFYVTEDGGVYEIQHKGFTDLKETVLRVVEKGVAPKCLREVSSRSHLISIAKTLGKVHPQLAVVIVP